MPTALLSVLLLAASVDPRLAEPLKMLAGVRTAVYDVTGEPFEELYRRFRRGIEASGLLREYRRRNGSSRRMKSGGTSPGSWPG